MSSRQAQQPLRIYARVPAVATLGPFLRYGLWVQGCPFSCAGCMTQGARPAEGGELWEPEDLAAEVLAVPGIEGVTLSGGEPFAQAEGLAAMLRRILARRDLGVIVYSGYRHEQLAGRARSESGVAGLLAMADLLVHGPYTEALNDDISLKGSSDQGVFLGTGRYAGHLYMYGPEYARRVEVHVGTREQMLVGVPSRRQLAWWRRAVSVSARA